MGAAPQRAFLVDRKLFPAGDCWKQGWQRRDLFVEISAFALRQNGGAPDEHQHLRKPCILDNESRQSVEPLCVCRLSSKVHQSMQPAAACRGLYERSNHGGLLSRVNLCARGCLWKSVLCEGDLCGNGGKLDGARGLAEGCAYPSLNVWPRWGKDDCRISNGWFLPGSKNGVPVPQLPLAWLSRVLGVVSRFGGDWRRV